MKNAAASFVLITNKEIIKEIATCRIRRRKMKKMRKKISKVDMKCMEVRNENSANQLAI